MPKAVSEEVELHIQILAFAVPVLAVNDPGFQSDASPSGTLPGALEALPFL